MRKKTKRIVEILADLYPNPSVPLDHDDHYSLLIATVLSAQCTDKRVNQVTPVLFARAENPHEMTKLCIDEIRDIVRPCGLSNTKSKAIFNLSQILIDCHGGKVPDSFQELEKLPGVGHKTASVVMAQAFGKPAFPVDTHIHRLAGRWALSNGKSVKQTERDLKEAFPKEIWNTLHLQMIYFGRQYCPARGHVSSDCPICSWAAPKSAIK